MSFFTKKSDIFLPPRNYTGRKSIEIEITISLVASGLSSI